MRNDCGRGNDFSVVIVAAAISQGLFVTAAVEDGFFQYGRLGRDEQQRRVGLDEVTQRGIDGIERMNPFVEVGLRIHHCNQYWSRWKKIRQ